MRNLVPQILLVDDNEPARYIKARTLRAAGWGVTEAGDGAETLRLAEEPGRFDLVVLDVNLPDTTGHELCRRLKSSHPELIILQTSATFIEPRDRAQGLDTGADAYLVEPAEDLEIVAQVRALLRLREAERRQREAESLLAHALEASAIAGWEWHAATDRSVWSKGMYELLGAGRDVIPSNTAFMQFVLPDDREALKRRLFAALEQRNMFEAEFRIRRGDGALRWLAARGRVVGFGEDRRMVGVNLDVTTRREVEVHRERLEQLIQHSTDFVALADVEGRLTFLNAAGRRMIGMDEAADLSGLDFTTYVAPGSLEMFRSTVLPTARAAGIWEGEMQLVNLRTGALVDVYRSTFSLRDEHCEHSGFATVMRDITERKRVEAALRESEERFATAFRLAPIAMAISSIEHGRAIDVNDALLAQLGYAHEEVVGRTARELGIYADPSDFASVRALLTEHGEVHNREVRLRRKDGGLLTGLLSAAPIELGGEKHLLTTMADITERKRAEDHVRLLMGEVNHRAKNLLAVVQAIAQQTAREAAPEEFTVRLTKRLQSLSASHDLIVRGNWKSVPLLELVRSQLSSVLGEPGGRVHMEGPAIMIAPAAAQGIGMALHELATNAIKHGALSNTQGQVLIAWSLEGNGEQRRFRIGWREQGGPAVEISETRGFGRTVIERMAALAVQGEAKLDFERSGFRWSLAAPETHVLAENE
jgi:PAS domain S-box-containing protein